MEAEHDTKCLNAQNEDDLCQECWEWLAEYHDEQNREKVK
jgi:hypothetical protein